jgi:hypothetical protein
MLKTLVIVVAGLAAGFTLATWWPQSEPASGPRVDSTSELPDRFAELELVLLEEIEQRAVLESRVQELSDRLEALGSSPAEVAIDVRSPVEIEQRAAAASAESVLDQPPVRRIFGRGASPEVQIEQLVAGGFTPARAEWISQRAAELRMQALQAQYDARREGTPLDPATIPGEQTLRTELGEVEYEQYLDALGRPTSVGVSNVLASSPAEQAGLKSGDEITGYAGTRVFDMRELNRLTFEGEAGEPVIVDVVRDGQQLQLVLPRGPVGITGGRFGGR